MVLVVTKAAKMLVAISLVANAVVGGSSSNSVAVMAARINVVVAIGNTSLLGRRCKIVGAIIIIIAVMVLVVVLVVDAIAVVACYFSFSAFLSIEA